MSVPTFNAPEFEAFYARNWKYVCKLCLYYLRSEVEAEDAAEDVFVTVLSRNIGFNDEIHERKWLTVSAINLCKNRLKSRSRRNMRYIDAESSDSVTYTDPRFGILEAVMDLPEKYKDVIWLYYYEGYRTDEIAALLARPPSTVRWQLKYARKLLRDIIGGDIY